MRGFEFLQEPTGESFRAILEFARNHCPEISFEESGSDRRPLTTADIDRLLGEGRLFYDAFQDVTFYGADGSVFISCISHEGIGWCEPSCFPEDVVRPLLERLHELEVAPPPDSQRRHVPYVFPDLSLDDLREIVFEGRAASIDLDNALRDYWLRRISEGYVPTAQDFRVAGELGRAEVFRDIWADAAEMSLLDRAQCVAVRQQVDKNWQEACVVSRIALCDLQRASDPDEKQALLDQILEFLPVHVNRNTVSYLWYPKDSAVSWALCAAVRFLDGAQVSQLRQIVRETEFLSKERKADLEHAISRHSPA